MWRSLSVAKKIYFSMGIIIVGYTVSMLFVITEGQIASGKLTTVSAALFPASQQSQAALTAFEQQTKNYEDAVTVGDKKLLEAAREKGEVAAKALDGIVRMSSLRSDDAKKTQESVQLLKSYTEKAQVIYTEMASGKMDQMEKAAELGKQGAELKEKLGALTQAFSKGLHAEISSIQTASQRDRFINIIGFIGVVVLALVTVTLVTRKIRQALLEAVDVSNRLADGDLTVTIVVGSSDETGQLMGAMQKMVGRIRDIAHQTVETANQVSIAADQISEANQSFSQKITEQAASVEETTAAMEEMGAATRSSAENAREANKLARSSKSVAEGGTAVMADTIAAMNEINKSSAKIANISNVIEEIAFQTNLLALNAAVEAARAGEHGKGFAVVAAEIRSLAGRTTQSAKEINTLIEDSGEKTGRGVQLAQELDKKLGEVVTGIKKVTDLMDEVAASAQEQSSGINQVNTAMSQVDQTTQQNASLVEETSASSEELAAQARVLLDVISFFKVDEGRGSTPAKRIRQEPVTRALPTKGAFKQRPAAARKALAAQTQASSDEQGDFSEF
jgi:methyl-accepting chemotaxis protein